MVDYNELKEKLDEIPKVSWDPTDPEVIKASVWKHFAARTADFHFLANGPRSEVWYTTELISAIGEASPGTWLAHRISGQETFQEISRSLGGRAFALGNHSSRRPDINIISGFSSEPRVSVIVEAKVIVNENIDEDLKGVGWSKKDSLLTQLDRATSLLPDTEVFGLVFIQWISGRQYQGIGDDDLFNYCQKEIEKLMSTDGKPKYDWKSEGIESVIPVSPVEGMSRYAQNTASLGIGLLALPKP